MAGYTSKSDFLSEIDKDVLGLVQAGLKDEDRFNQIALKLFELQGKSIKPYRQYCENKNISPQNIADWKEVPAIASFSFRKLLFASVPSKEAHEIYEEGRTLELPKKRGPVFPDKKIAGLINAAGRISAKAFLFPDIERIKMLFMAPSPKMAPGMVMARGLAEMRQEFGTKDSMFVISLKGLDIKALLSSLRQAEKQGLPLALLGATWGFDYFLDACKREGIRFNLPKGSRIIDSGGYMGRYTKCSKEDFMAKCKEIFGIEGDFSINSLWICESSTVYFDNTIKNSFSGIKRQRFKEIPVWCRVSVVSPKDFKALPKGKIGLLRLYDLTNRGMAFAVQTDKLGIEVDDGFEVIGKWNKDMTQAEVDPSAAHPGGRLLTRAIDYSMSRKLSELNKVYFSLK